ncbi:MAG: helix-turn-helix transcriptional regulator [Dehalococcoidia bacterium]|nr:helix-turn-helix transcriptional regulator [Dehalococcoidia bacterium]
MERNRDGRPRHPDILTPGEWRVLEELRKGGTNAEIAVWLGISPDAVKYHLSNMLGKLDLHDPPRSRRLAARLLARLASRVLLATPAGFVSLTRPLLRAGVGAVGLTGVASWPSMAKGVIDKSTLPGALREVQLANNGDH